MHSLLDSVEIFANFLSDLIISSWFLLQNVGEECVLGEVPAHSLSYCFPVLVWIASSSIVLKNFLKVIVFFLRVSLIKIRQYNLETPLRRPIHVQLRQAGIWWKQTCQVRVSRASLPSPTLCSFNFSLGIPPYCVGKDYVAPTE